MDAPYQLCNVASEALRPTYRLALLGSEDKKMPLMMWMNPNGNHYQVAVIDVDDAIAACADGKKLDVFVVDSLKWGLKKDSYEAVKLYTLATIRFMEKGHAWMRETLTKPRKELFGVVKGIVSGTFLDEVKKITLNPQVVSMKQTNGFDCGIFCVIQMNRLCKHLYSGDFKTGVKLTKENVQECLQLTIGRSKAPSQKFVTLWRTSEFLYLLSLWISTFTNMIVTHQGLKGLNEHLNTNFKTISEVPYTSVIFQGDFHYIQSVNTKKWELTINKPKTEALTVSWQDVNIMSSPTASELEKMFIINLKEESDKVKFVPSTNDLCRFFPGHTEDKDKYIGSDYIIWKLQIMDSKFTSKPDGPDVNVGLGINTFSVEKATKFMEDVNPSKKRKRAEEGSSSESVSLLNEDDD